MGRAQKCQQLLTLLVSVTCGGVLQLNERGVPLQVKGEQDGVLCLEVIVEEAALRLFRFDAAEGGELRLSLRSFDDRFRAFHADVVLEQAA